MSRPQGFWGWTLAAVALALAGFHLYTAFFGVLTPLLQRFIHLLGVLLLALGLWGWAGNRPARPDAASAALWVLAALLGVFFLWSLTPARIADRGFLGPSALETWAGGLLLLLVLEATRRSVGLPIVLVATAFLVYGLAGPWMPEMVAHKGYSAQRLIAYLVWTTDGIFGIPIAVSATFVAVFIIFGALLDKLGAGAYFLNLAMAASGRLAGGPALTAVVASGLMGSISGSAVSNVVTTGAFTIPLMIKSGYRPVYAAAVEAAASTGGQIMPPVMGAAAFVLAELTGVPYSRVALAAALPAVCYFLCVGLMVYFEARRRDLRGLPPAELPPLGRTLISQVHLCLPLALLVWLLVGVGYSPMKSGAWTIACLAAVGSLAALLREHRLPWRRLLEALQAGARIAAPVACACAAAGVMIGVVSLTGLGVRFTRLLILLSGGELWLALVLMMLACIVLGTGLPTTAAYVITAVLGAPALVKMGVPLFAAHLFIFYFAIISFITPPVAISAYAAAGLAGSGPMRTGFWAFGLGIAGFLVPFYFVFHPALILQGSWWQVLTAAAGALVGLAALAGALEGWFGGRLGWGARGLLILAAVASASPGLWLPLAAAAATGGVLISRRLAVRAAARLKAPA
ncbi:MAG: TRAP transporter fused permease subunit [Thermodesulfobacteriota bacterium]